MSTVSAVLACLMAAIAGGTLVLGFLGRPLDRHALGVAAGLGYPLGIGLVGLTLWLGERVAGVDATRFTGLLLLLVTAACSLLAWRHRSGRALIARERLPPWQWAVWGMLLAMLVAGGVMQSAEALTRPIFPWDAWSAWSVKARVWWELGADIDFVSFDRWLAAEDPRLFTNEAWQYPELVPLFQLWVLRWAGHWNEHFALLPWSFLYPAMLLGIYHLSRLLGVSILAAMIICFAVGALPILQVQFALPGLIDAWIAAELLGFGACVMLGIQSGQFRWLMLALAFLGLAAATKLEGLVWLVICLPVVLVAATAKRFHRYVVPILLGAIAIWWLAGGFSFRLGDGLEFTVRPELIELPYLGSYPLAFRNSLGGLGQSFLILPNWHLAGYLLLPMTLWMLIAYRHHPTAGSLAMFLFMGLAFMFVLFFMTRAAIWAESMTASNRLVLQFAPAIMLWTGVLLARYLASGAATTSR